MSRRKQPNSVGVLLRIPIFRRMWAAIAVSSLGDWLGLLATTALAAYLTRDSSDLAQGAAVSGVLLTRLLPDLILGPIAGALVDKLDRRKVAVIGDTLAGLLYLSIILGGNLTLLLIAQFLVEAVGLFTNPAKQALWVNIVPRERLAVANQLNYVSMYGMVPVAALLFALMSTLAQFFGAPVLPDSETTGALVSGGASRVAIDVALAFDAATYFFAATVIGVSRRMIPSFVGERAESKNVFSLILEGISFVKNSAVMRAIYVGILGAFGAGGLVAGVAQAYVATLGAGNAGYGILFGSVFTGLALGMLVGPKVLPTVPRRAVFTTAIGAAGLCLLVMALLQDFAGSVFAAAVMGLFAGIAWITGFTMIGHEVSDQLRGRVFAFVMSSVRLTLLGTIALGPILAGAIGTHVLTLGTYTMAVTGPALVLGAGGLVAIAVSAFAGRQVGGGWAGGALGRLLRRRRHRLLTEEADHPGVLVAVEGADPETVARYAAALSARLAADGWLTWDDEPLSRNDDGGLSDSPASALRAVADLADLTADRLQPALDAGAVVVSAGFIDAVVVRYGALGGQDEERILRMALWATGGIRADLTVLVDSPGADTPDAAVAEGVMSDDDGVALDADSDEPVDVPQAYRDRAGSAPERYLVVSALVDGALPAEVVDWLASVLRVRNPVKADRVA